MKFVFNPFTGRFDAVTSGSGTSGSTGLQGPPGLDGQDGEPGDQGSPGPAGSAGATGAAGADGAQGAAGLQGPPGMDGLDGDPGETGPSGMLGSSGLATRVAFWETVTTLTSTTPASVGELYWDNVNGFLGSGTATPTAALTGRKTGTDPISTLARDVVSTLAQESNAANLLAVYGGASTAIGHNFLRLSGSLGTEAAPTPQLSGYTFSGIGFGSFLNGAHVDTAFIRAIAASDHSNAPVKRATYLTFGTTPDSAGAPPGFAMSITETGMVLISSTDAAPTIGVKLRVADGHVLIDNTGVASELRFTEPSGSGTNITSFKAQAQAADLNYTWPAALLAGGVLTTDGSGGLTWSSLGATGPPGVDGEDGIDGVPGPIGPAGASGSSTPFTFDGGTDTSGLKDFGVVNTGGVNDVSFDGGSP